MEDLGPGSGAHAVAREFVAARRAARPLPSYPGDAPASLGEAYAIQDAAIGMWDVEIAGWKVGRINPPVEGQERLIGPIFRAAVFGLPTSGGSRTMTVHGGGFAAAEAEFLLRIGRDADPSQRAFSMDDARNLVDAAHVGIEIASSPFGGINEHGPAVTISDFGNNNGLLVGPALVDWRDADLLSLPVALRVNGGEVGSGTAATMLDGPLGAVRFLAGLLADRGLPLRAGQWVSTGAVTGVHQVRVGDRVEATFGPDLRVSCVIAAEVRA